jgi:hypothetical protein
LDQTIVQPQGAFFLTKAQLDNLTKIGVLDSQVIPQFNAIIAAQTLRFPTGLLEPHHTFRFSVNRTF